MKPIGNQLDMPNIKKSARKCSARNQIVIIFTVERHYCLKDIVWLKSKVSYYKGSWRFEKRNKTIATGKRCNKSKTSLLPELFTLISNASASNSTVLWWQVTKGYTFITDRKYEIRKLFFREQYDNADFLSCLNHVSRFAFHCPQPGSNFLNFLKQFQGFSETLAMEHQHQPSPCSLYDYLNFIILHDRCNVFLPCSNQRL